MDTAIDLYLTNTGGYLSRLYIIRGYVQGRHGLPMWRGCVQVSLEITGLKNICFATGYYNYRSGVAQGKMHIGADVASKPQQRWLGQILGGRGEVYAWQLAKWDVCGEKLSMPRDAGLRWAV